MRLFRATVALCALLPLTACAIVVPPLHSPTPTPLPDPVTTSKSAVPQEVVKCVWRIPAVLGNQRGAMAGARVEYRRSEEDST